MPFNDYWPDVYQVKRQQSPHKFFLIFITHLGAQSGYFLCRDTWSENLARRQYLNNATMQAFWARRSAIRWSCHRLMTTTCSRVSPCQTQRRHWNSRKHCSLVQLHQTQLQVAFMFMLQKIRFHDLFMVKFSFSNPNYLLSYRLWLHIHTLLCTGRNPEYEDNDYYDDHSICSPATATTKNSKYSPGQMTV